MSSKIQYVLENPIKLGIWNNELEQRAEAICTQIKAHLIKKSITVDNFKYKVCDYKQGSEMPVIDETFIDFKCGDKWGDKFDSHAWFYKKINFFWLLHSVDKVGC